MPFGSVNTLQKENNWNPSKASQEVEGKSCLDQYLVQFFSESF